MSLSLRGYAAHRKGRGLPGGSLRAVQKAIRDGRLNQSLVIIDGHRQIADPDAADLEWIANTDEARQVTDNDSEFAYWRTKKMKLDYRKAAGELVDAAEVQAAIEGDYTTVRNKLLGLPSKAKQRLPHLTLADLATLDDIVREALEALAAPEAQ